MFATTKPLIALLAAPAHQPPIGESARASLPRTMTAWDAGRRASAHGGTQRLTARGALRQRGLRKPWARMPHSRKASNSALDIPMRGASGARWGCPPSGVHDGLPRG